MDDGDNDDGDDAENENDDCPAWTINVLLPQLRAAASTAASAESTSATTTTTTTTNTIDSNDWWKVMIVYSTHGHASEEVENFVHIVQGEFPNLQIVGGICQGGFVSLPHHRRMIQQPNDYLNQWTNQRLVDYIKSMGLRPPAAPTKAMLVAQIQEAIRTTHPFYLQEIGHDTEGIFGIVLGGHIPVQTVVSRGVKSNITNGPPQTTSDYAVAEAHYHRPDDEAYMFNTETRGELPPYHMIRSVRHKQTGQVIPISRWVVAHGGGAGDLVGLRRVGGVAAAATAASSSTEVAAEADALTEQDGFCLHMPHPLSRNLGGFLFFQDTTLPMQPLENYEIDLYTLDGGACRQDVHATLQALSQEVSTQKLLGACMFSCNGRGPQSGMLGEPMADAAAWAKYFPQVPLLGFYAGGEIGPLAMAGRRAALRGQDGRQVATLQGFTAVFALWIVPKEDWTLMPHLDDSDETVQKFCTEKLLTSVGGSS